MISGIPSSQEYRRRGFLAKKLWKGWCFL